MQIAFFVSGITIENVYHLRLAELMIRSARKHMKVNRIVQMTDTETPRLMDVDECRRIPRELPLMPYRLHHHSMLGGETIFVDTDVMFNADVRDVFHKPFDVCVTERRNEVILDAQSRENVVIGMPYNTGVIFSRSRDFWLEAYQHCMTLPVSDQDWYGDQLSVKHVAEGGRFKVAELPCEFYNYTPDSKTEDISERKILHFKGRRKNWMLFDKFKIVGGVEVPKYRTYSAIDDPQRHENMAIALKQGFPMLEQSAFHDGEISIACYGPSLKETWQQLKQPIMSVAGAHDFLIERGVIPTYHIDCDPREYKAEYVKHAHPDVTYLMGSCQHPKTWDYLRGKKVLLWHVYNGQDTTRWLSKNRPDLDTVPAAKTLHVAICGGSTIGLRAIEVCGFLGFKNLHVHGMDSSLQNGERHAGKHNGEPQKTVGVRVGEGWFQSTPQMIEAARECINVISRYAPIGVRFTFYGHGMLQEMIQQSIAGNNDFRISSDMETKVAA